MAGVLPILSRLLSSRAIAEDHKMAEAYSGLRSMALSVASAVQAQIAHGSRPMLRADAFPS